MGAPDYNLSWSPHIATIVGKANTVLVFFRRNFTQCQRDLEVKSYLTYIRPIVEYPATVWSPYTQCNIHSVEMIQRKAARFVFNDFPRLSGDSTMLELLG